MAKRILIIFSCIILTFSLCACESEKSYKNESQEEDSSEPLIKSLDWGMTEDKLLAQFAADYAFTEDEETKQLIILVILNRVWSGNFPNSVENVVYEIYFDDCDDGAIYHRRITDECYDAVYKIKYNGWNKSENALYFAKEGGYVNPFWTELYTSGSYTFYK